MSGTKEVNRYYSPKSERLVRKLKEAREKENAAVEQFHLRASPPILISNAASDNVGTGV